MSEFRDLIIGSTPKQIMLEHVFIYWGFSYILLCLFGYRFNPPITTIVNVLFNQCVVGNMLVNMLPIIPPEHIVYDTYFIELFYTLVYVGLYYLFHCVWFYGIHRLLHVRVFWRHIHYVHHMHRVSMPYTALYCHPVEHAIANVMSVFIGPIIFPSNIIALKIWLHLGTMYTVNAHFSELRSNNPGVHDLHHLFYRFNYGTGSTMDKIFGTYMKPN